MNIKKSSELVIKVFDVINNANKIEDISELLITESELSKNKINISKYPKIEFDLTQDDINSLKMLNYLSLDNKFKISKEELNEQSIITKLLYSIIWKNGDLGKEKHIIDGLLNIDKTDEKGLVFYNFGKYLGDKKEPIIDQHTLRSYGIYLCINNEIKNIIERIPERRKNFKKMDITYYRKLSITSKKELPLIEDYKNWIKKNKLYKNKDFVYTLDLILFALGKAIKSKDEQILE